LGEPTRAGETKGAQPARNYINGLSPGALEHLTSTLEVKML
jgi:hypothetical protein